MADGEGRGESGGKREGARRPEGSGGGGVPGDPGSAAGQFRRLPPPEIVGESGAIRAVLRLVARMAPLASPVLILGESGTGKELVARSLHALGPRAAGPFVGENCAALSEGVVESELFGHVRGAFTGAQGQRPGLFQIAHRGTLFLDEVGDLSPRIQGKLLRVLQEGEFRPVGGRDTVRVDARVVCATHRDLPRMVDRGEFRADLYYRLSVLHLRLPPLRERREDVAILGRRFMDEISRRDHGARRFHLSTPALSALERYSWPGNVRELRNVLEAALALCEGGVVQVRDLPPRIVEYGLAEADDGYGTRMNAERRMIESALARAGGNKTRAAADIGWNRPKLYRRMRKLGIVPGGSTHQEG